MNKKIIWGIIIAVVVIVGGYFTFIHKITGGPDYGLAGPATRPTDIPMASDWKTYTNTKDGYSISYPVKYHEAFGSDLLNYDENKYEKGNSDGVKIQIVPQEMNSIQQVNEVLKIVYSGKVTAGPGGAFDVWNVYGKNEVLYFKINIWGYSNDRPTIEKILQTFKFTTTTTSNTQPSITVLSPNGGEVYKPGQHVKITWKNNTSYPNVSVIVVAGKVADGHYTTNGSMGTYRGYYVYNGVNKDSFDWTVPTEYPGEGEYYIRISPAVGENTLFEDVDYSDARFTITN